MSQEHKNLMEMDCQIDADATGKISHPDCDFGSA